MSSRSWTHSLASLFGWLFGLFLLGSCGEPGLLIDTGTWPESVVALRVHSKLDGVSGAEQYIDPGQSRFVLYVPERHTSRLEVELTGLNGVGCQVAQGKYVHTFESTLQRVKVAAVSLLPIEPALCTLTLNVPSEVTVSDDSGVICTGGTSPCLITRPFNTLMRLTATAADPSWRLIWPQDCFTFPVCEFSLSHSRTIDLVVGPPGCSADGWCAAFPSSRLDGTLRSITDSGSDEIWAAGNGGLLFHCTPSGCSRIQTGITANLTSVSAAKNGEVWAVSDQGDVLICANERCNRPPNWPAGPQKSGAAAVTVDELGVAWIAQVGRSRLLRCLTSGCSDAHWLTPSISAPVPQLASTLIPSPRILLTAPDHPLQECLLVNAGCTLLGSLPRINSFTVLDTDVWTVGYGGLQRVCSRTPCTQLPQVTVNQLWSVSAVSPGTIWAVGASRTIVLCDALGCRLVPIANDATTARLVKVVADGTTGAWVIGDAGLILHCTLQRCVRTATDFAVNLTDIRQAGSAIWAVGEKGVVLRRNL